MKTNSKISAYILRRGIAVLLFSCVVVALSTAIDLPNDPSKFPAPQNNTASGVNGRESASPVAAPAIRSNRTLTFSDRVAFQRAIEEVYWRHRIWPKANPGLKPRLEKVMSQTEIEKKVEDYLGNSQALEDYWQRPITPDELQAEMERIASHTKQPGVLREVFAALGNDPFVIAECLARPLVAERLITESYVHDQRFHGQLKRRAEAELKTHPSVTQIKRTSGMYTETEWIKTDSAETSSAPDETKTIGAIKMNGSDWQESVNKLAADFGNTKAGDAWSQIKTGVLSPLQEDEGHYYAVAVMKMGKDRLKLANIAWLKEPLRSWLAKAETQVPVTMAAISANYALPVIASPSVACTEDTWTPTSLTNAPTQRFDHTAVWTGSEMIVWGGSFSVFRLNTGGRYNPSTDSWTATSTTDAPSLRTRHTAVWTGTEMIVWGGLGSRFLDLNTGGRYNPGTDSWTATGTTGAPAGRRDHTAVWTGTRMIVWGGAVNDISSNTGGRYNPSIDSWQSTSTTNAPSPRSGHTAVSADGQMIVWGGITGSNIGTGGRYNPVSDSWTATSTTGAPNDRFNHTAVWTGSQMIVWGGSSSTNPLITGGRYNLSNDSWTATSTTGAPSQRTRHTAVWAGTEMIVWGGLGTRFLKLNTGGRYDPGTDSWTATSTTSVPSARSNHTAVWTGSQMIVWGGYGDHIDINTNTGGRYCPRRTRDAVEPAVSVATP